jgi:hypothetical protein
VLPMQAKRTLANEEEMRISTSDLKQLPQNTQIF